MSIVQSAITSLDGSADYAPLYRSAGRLAGINGGEHRGHPASREQSRDVEIRSLSRRGGLEKHFPSGTTRIFAI